MKKIYLLFAMMFLSIIKVNAIGNYTNENGVLISQKFVNRVSMYIKPEVFEFMNQQDYDFYYQLYSGDYSVDQKYIITANLVQNGEVLDTVENIMNEFEYELVMNQMQPQTICYDEDACWQTSSKKITMTTSNSTACSVSVGLEWLTTPSTKSYDVIASMWDQSATKNYSGAYQFYKDTNGQLYSINYDTVSGTNTKQFSNGMGVSMNLVDDATYWDALIYNNLTCSSDMTFRASYQHATSNVSLSTSKSYNLSTSGLGGVINFNGSIGNYYDGMQGLILNVPKV